MTWTTEAWLREALGALKRTLDVDARTKNEMVQFLLDEGFWDKEKLSTWESAIAKFNSCLNPNKSEFFKVGELWALSKRFGRHELFLAMAADLGYEVRRLPTEERQQELLEQLAYLQVQHGEALERISTQLAQLQAAPHAPPALPIILVSGITSARKNGHTAPVRPWLLGMGAPDAFVRCSSSEGIAVEP